MRRPAPLPTDPDAPKRPGGADAQESIEVAAVLPPRVDAARPAPLGPVSTDSGLAAPAAPLSDPGAGRDDDAAGAIAAGAAEADGTDEPVVEAMPQNTGVREVWAAARARRKALRAEVRRFTVRQRRRRMLWFSVFGALALLVLGTLGAAYSPLFAVERVRVVGADTLDATAVEAALSGQLGTPLARVDASAVRAVLVQFPLVESYTLEARPPHELVVRIVERTPIGSIESAAGYTLVDAAGVALATTPEPDPAHPVITASGGIGSPAFDAIGTVYRSLPDDIRAQVTAMSATTGNDVTLTLGGTGTDVVWGNADESAYKAVVLAAAMVARPPQDVYSYDVSSPSAVVIR